MLASVTRLRPRRFWHLPLILIDSLGIAHQVRRAEGFAGGYLAFGSGPSLWTVTVWRDLDAMRAFRNKGAHVAAMPTLLDRCDQASYTHWEQSEPGVPAPDEARRRLQADGKLSKLRRPSPEQARGIACPERNPPVERRRLRPA